MKNKNIGVTNTIVDAANKNAGVNNKNAVVTIKSRCKKMKA
jgi:hypothetical protein